MSATLDQIIAEAKAGKLNWKRVGTFPEKILTTDEAWDQFVSARRASEYKETTKLPICRGAHLHHLWDHARGKCRRCGIKKRAVPRDGAKGSRTTTSTNDEEGKRS